MQSAFLLLGTNLGDRSFHLRQGREKLRHIGELKAASGVYVTAPWGFTDQPEFWNQAIELLTNLSPENLLKAIKKIEEECGRSEQVRWGPRELDIDILAYGDRVVDTVALKIPHPRLGERRFALIPFNEIEKSWRHPLTGKSISDLLNECTDPLSVTPLNS